jgi:hypothetical protein
MVLGTWFQKMMHWSREKKKPEEKGRRGSNSVGSKMLTPVQAFD